MTYKKRRITYRATDEGIKRANNALKRDFGSKTNFTKYSVISRSTISKFFSQKPIQFDCFQKICEELKLSDWREIAGIKQTEKLKGKEIDRLSSTHLNEGREPVQTLTRQITVVDEPNNTVIAVITLQGNIDSAPNKEIFETILHKHSGKTIKIIDFKEGSIKLFVEGSLEDIKQIVFLIKSKEITELSGFPIKEIEILDESSDVEETTESNNKWSLIKEIVSQPVKGRKLRGADLSDANLSGADLRGADLRGANLIRADLIHANLSGADLSGADLSDANLSGTNLSGADLNNAILTGAMLIGNNVENAALIDTSNEEEIRTGSEFGKDTSAPSGTDQSIPYVISPRQTFVDTQQPKLRWNKVKDATCYTVKIIKDSDIFWEQKVINTEIKYPSNPPLESSITYSLIVESDNGYSSESDSEVSKLVFGLLDGDSIREVQNEIEAVNKQGLTEEEQTLALSDIFINYGLNAKAIEILEQQVYADSKNPAIYVQLGNLYRFTGLNLLAEKQYRKALNLVRGEQDLKEQIIAKFGLAKILPLLNREDEANGLSLEVKQELETMENSKNRELKRTSSRNSCIQDREFGECFVSPAGN